MNASLKIYNSLSRKKEIFEPLNPPFVGMYSCGPTVYNEPHIGNMRTFTMFDMMFRYLQSLGYKVRYVRNITDCGHLTNDAGQGVDRIQEASQLEKLEPMEIVQKYSNSFHELCRTFNLLPPTIEPTATGHIIEQIEMVKKIIEAGFGYESKGSVYFDVRKYATQYKYGELSGRNIDELLNNTREDLEGAEEKRDPLDFAIWKSVSANHIQRWPSPWGEGIPGWHLECSAMAIKYLGETFDIHGGGMDLKFPHHECEIAQSVGAYGKAPARFWLHANMLTVNGDKMSKSKGNSFSARELFSGDNQVFEKAFSPMVVKFFMLQCHYRSTLDFSNDALMAAEKGYMRLMEAYKLIPQLKAELPEADAQIQALIREANESMLDDFNSAQTIASLFELASLIFKIKDGSLKASREGIAELQQCFDHFLFVVFGLQKEQGQQTHVVGGLMDLILEIRKDARTKKDFSTSDKIRDSLSALKINIKDGKEGSSWSL